MLLKLGHGMAGTGKVQSGGGMPAATYSTFEIAMNNATSYADWAAVYEILMYDTDSNEFFQALAALDEGNDDMASVSAGEFASNSTYGAVNSRAFLNDGSPDVVSPTSPISSGNGEWSSSIADDLNIFIKPSSARSLGRILMAVNTQGTYQFDPTVPTFFGDGGQLTPTSTPANINDIYQTTGNASVDWFEWVF